MNVASPINKTVTWCLPPRLGVPLDERIRWSWVRLRLFYVTSTQQCSSSWQSFAGRRRPRALQCFIHSPWYSLHGRDNCDGTTGKETRKEGTHRTEAFDYYNDCFFIFIYEIIILQLPYTLVSTVQIFSRHIKIERFRNIIF